jgi:hypothetical protein
MVDLVYMNPEPVPPASQLAVLPLLAAIDGFLREDGDVPGLRVTMHRTMSREGDRYLQQVCAYVNGDGAEWRGKVGRTFPVNEGVMGAAFGDGRIWRTKAYSTLEALRTDLRAAMPAAGDPREPEAVPVAYLAIPFLGPQQEVILILYADCNQLNFFAVDDRVRRVTSMCRGFCRLFDWLQRDPFPNLRNFPLQKGAPVTGLFTVYASIQEPVATIAPPQFKEVLSFNYEAAVA